MTHTITFTYLNHNGRKSVRTVDVDAIEFHHRPSYGYQPGWAISGFDREKQARRSFFLNRIIFDDSETLRNVFTLMRL